VLHVYAFVEPPVEIGELVGIAGEPATAEAGNGVTAVVTRHAEAPVASEEAILAHARVVDALAAEHESVVPARFGAVYADEPTLRAALLERSSELEAALARVRGSIELGIRALAPVANREEARTGLEYMRGQLDRRRDAERLAAELHEPLAELAVETTQSVAATPRLVFSAAYLVSRANVAAFRDAVTRLQDQHPELGLVCTGPWPPYSFVTADRMSA
jgi:Gas vesicle synthesis protein GvpL/GvpF